MRRFAKIISVILCSLSVLCGSLFLACNQTYRVNFATAYDTANDASYLFDTFNNQQDYQEKYNISANELMWSSRPIDDSTKDMMPGASIAPSPDQYWRFEKSLNTNQTTLSQNKSLYIYLYFGLGSAHNLQISLSNTSNSNAMVKWYISADTLNEQLYQDQGNIESTRMAWLLLELPVTVATYENFENLQQTEIINNLQIKYYTDLDNLSDELQSVDLSEYFATCKFYAPYVADSQNQAISLLQSQPYYNLSVNFGNINNICVGDTYKIDTISSFLNYCLVGEMEITQATDNYIFVLTIKKDDEDDYTAYTLSDIEQGNYTFDEVGKYSFILTFYNEAQTFSVSEYQTIWVEEYVGFYISGGLPSVKINTTYRYPIEVGSFASEISNLQVSSSNADVASAIIDGQYLVVNSKKAGTVTITITGDTIRNNAVSATSYTKTYTFTVVATSTTNWIAIAIGAVGLVVAAIIVYFIMVKRRLIKGKYPKY